ncbi:MAG: DUF2807 domain-containing protein [Bacteroidales bacterium]|nr:DUF2807 domain-containing protein [Bacteroidales bacterium]
MNRTKYLAIVVATACMTSCNMLAEDYKEYLKEHTDEVMTINPGGEVQTHNIEVGEFNAIESKFGIMDIEYSQTSDQPAAQLICNNEIMALADIYVDNEVLHIEMNDGMDFEDIHWETDKNYQCVLKCSSKQLKSITQKGSGNLTLKTAITGDVLEIDMSGMGNFECLQPLDVEVLNISSKGSGNAYLCGNLNRGQIEFSGMGDLNINGTLSAQYLDVEMNGSGNIKISKPITIDTLEIETSGMGNVDIDGTIKIKVADISMSGSGNINGNSLHINNLNIETSGMGNVNIDSFDGDNIAITSSGSGNTTIKKLNSKDMQLSCSGMGDVKVKKGIATNVSINYSGSGSLNAKGLSADNMQFVASGIGDHRIGEVKNSLNVKLRDKTSLTYSGNPASVKENIGKKAKLNKR